MTWVLLVGTRVETWVLLVGTRVETWVLLVGTRVDDVGVAQTPLNRAGFEQLQPRFEG